jgi:hypothetical protein
MLELFSLACHDGAAFVMSISIEHKNLLAG